VKARNQPQTEALFHAGAVDLLEPGVVLVHRWHPDKESRWYQWREEPPMEITDSMVHMYGGIAAKR